MATFTLRTSTTASALRSATLDTLRKRTYYSGWHLYVSGVDAILRVPLESFRVTDPGPGATGRLEALHIDQARAYPIAAGSLVELVDGTAETVLWLGFIASRELLPTMPAGSLTRIDAVHVGSLLDSSFIPSDTIPAGWDDRTAVHHLVSGWGHGILRAPDATVEVTNTSLPEITITALTLGQALRLVADAAGEDRVVWVDAKGRVNYGRIGVANAPYAISDSPDGVTSIAPTTIGLDVDEASIINRLWVTNPDGSYGEWIEDAASIAAYGPRDGWLTNEAVNDASAASFYGLAYLAKTATPAYRGQLTVEGYDGWAAGQVLTITCVPLGLSGATFQIREVATEFQTGTPRRKYTLTWGEMPKSLARQLAKEIG